MGLFLGVLADPMAIERREIIENFRKLTSIFASLGFKLDRDIQDNVF